MFLVIVKVVVVDCVSMIAFRYGLHFHSVVALCTKRCLANGSRRVCLLMGKALGVYFLTNLHIGSQFVAFLNVHLPVLDLAAMQAVVVDIHVHGEWQLLSLRALVGIVRSALEPVLSHCLDVDLVERLRIPFIDLCCFTRTSEILPHLDDLDLICLGIFACRVVTKHGCVWRSALQGIYL